jgi:hypothetical protein
MFQNGQSDLLIKCIFANAFQLASAVVAEIFKITDGVASSKNAPNPVPY